MDRAKSLGNRGMVLLLAAVFLFMLALNYMVPLFNDDYFYVLNLNSEEVITDFAGVISSIYNFREGHNGRIAAHFFAQLFLWLPRVFFIIINAAMYTLLSYGVYRYARSENQKRNFLLLFCSAAMMWLLVPGFGHGFLWLTGSCSYLWAVTFIMLFIHPFYKAYADEDEREKFRVLREIPAVAYAFFVGSYSENGSFSALAVVFCFMALIFIREKRLPLKFFLRFVSACAGFLFLMLSPSEIGKKNAEASGGPMFPMLENLGISAAVFFALVAVLLVAAAILLWAIIRCRKPVSRALAWLATVAVAALSLLLIVFEARSASSLLDSVNLIASNVLLSLVLMFGIYFILLMWALNLEVEMKKILAAVVFGLGAIASLAVFLVAIYFPARGAGVAAVYTTAASLLLLSGICDKLGEKPGKAFALAVLIFLLPTMIAGTADAHSVYRQYENRKTVIAQAQADGVDKLLLDQITSVGKYTVTWQGEAADYHQGMETYYDIPTIIIIGTEEF